MSTAASALQSSISSDQTVRRRVDVEALYASVGRRLERVVGRDVDAPAAVIEDACQVAWIRLIRHADRIEPGAAFAWLLHTATREARRQVRRRGREVSLAAIPDVSLLLPDALQAEQLEHRECLLLVGRLPVRQQRIAWLRAAGFSHAEVGQRTEDSVRTVERQLGRARAKLRAELAA
jgi:RNA polymerase sigma factor (sigma-70 family)